MKEFKRDMHVKYIVFQITCKFVVNIPNSYCNHMDIHQFNSMVFIAQLVCSTVGMDMKDLKQFKNTT